MLTHLRLCPLLLLCLMVAACDMDSARPTPDIASISYIGLSPTAPPDTAREAIPVINDPQKEIWRPGYWSYSGGGFTWVPGEVMPRPSPTAVWSPDVWVMHDYGYAFVAGYWQ